MFNPDQADSFFAGQTPFQNGSFWLLSLLKFKSNAPDARGTYSKYFSNAIEASVRSVQGTVVLKMFDNVATVIDGGGAVPQWDACTIVAFPSPAALQHLQSKYEYVKHFSMGQSVVEASECHVFDGSWNDGKLSSKQGKTKSVVLNASQPNFDLDLSEATRLAELKLKDKARMSKIEGNPKTFLKWFRDERFEEARIWQLNLLKLEKSNTFYQEYGARAESIISSGGTGGSGGMKFMCGSKGVHTLRGVNYDIIVAMQYPDRTAFLKFASSQNSKSSNGKSEKRMEGGRERQILRTAGLEVQGLVCLSPDAVDGIRDPNAPRFARL
jgi:hypothetical protein